MTESPLIFAKELDGNGGAIEHTDLQVAQAVTNPCWFHFDGNHPGASDLINTTFPDIDDYILQVIFDPDARPRALQVENGTLVILRGINHNKGDEPEDMIAVRLWITEKRIISLRYRKSRAVTQVAESLEQHRGPKTIGDIFTLISLTMFSYIESSIDRLEDKIDEVEENVLDEPDRQLRRDISGIRKTSILLRRYIAPQKEAISHLRLFEVKWLLQKNQQRLMEAQDILLRAIEQLDMIRERSQVVKDELVNALSDRLNRNLYVLSVITAIFLPLGFLTGLFGINIGGMPGVDNDMAFTFFSVSLIVIVVIQIVLFKFFKWF